MGELPSTTCFACGSALRTEGSRRAVCTNPACPVQGTRYLCEFCNQYSVTPRMEGLVCNNPSCRMHDALRKGCPHCRKISLISFQGSDLCLNRRCPSNSGRLATCVFCEREAMHMRPDYGICIKAHCDEFLVPVVKCFFCGQMSHNREKMACENPKCSMRGVRVEMCADCGSRAKVADPNHPERGNCLDPNCSQAKQKPIVGGENTLGFSGTFMLGPDQMKDIDRLLSGGKKDPPRDERPTMPEQPPPPPKPVGASLFDGPDLNASPTAVPQGGGWRPPQEKLPPRTEIPKGASAVPADGAGFAQSGIPTEQSSRTPFVPEAPRRVPPVEAPVPPEIRPDASTETQPAPASVSQDADKSPIVRAFEFVKEYVIGGADGGPTPVYLVIGTAGAGKTTYLTMLGEILRAREMKYHFPFDGVDVRRILVEELLEARKDRRLSEQAVTDIKRHVRDLVFDFAQKEYSSTISRGHWPGQTPPEESSSCFLVAEIVRHQKPVARIVTFETSGEDFQAALRGITEYDPNKTATKPLHKMLYDLMDMAAGFIILMTPEGRENDETYRDFFLAMRDGLEPQALNVLSEMIRKKLDVTKAPEPSGFAPEKASLTGIIQGFAIDTDKERRRSERREKIRREHVARLRSLRVLLSQGDMGVLQSKEGSFLKELEHAFGTLHPEQIAKARQALQEKGITRERVMAYYNGLMDMIEREIDDIIAVLDSGEDDSAVQGGFTREEFERALLEVKQEHGLSDDFRIDPDALMKDLYKRRESRRFRQLRRVSLAFTKTDMYPATYPPENHPARNLPDSKLYIDMVDNYLKLLGGRILYYNSSTIGYSVLRDTLYVPGPENTLTPINVVEPVFDMLGIR